MDKNVKNPQSNVYSIASEFDNFHKLECLAYVYYIQLLRDICGFSFLQQKILGPPLEGLTLKLNRRMKDFKKKNAVDKHC